MSEPKDIDKYKQEDIMTNKAEKLWWERPFGLSGCWFTELKGINQMNLKKIRQNVPLKIQLT